MEDYDCSDTYCYDCSDTYCYDSNNGSCILEVNDGSNN
jgi:hypothetical protein